MRLPNFLTSRQIDLAIATSGYCQARCSGCIWPYMEKSNQILSTQDFVSILDRFDDFKFGELALNIINEPFTDKTIVDKLIAISERQQNIDVLYFSSNWLIPNQSAIDKFVSAIQKCAESENIRKIHLNATISGIDQRSYDIQQAGANLTDAVVPYCSLDFEKAVDNVCSILLGLSKINGVEKIKFRIKSYGDIFTLKDMQEFWEGKFSKTDIPDDLIKRQVKIGQNESFTTFARSPSMNSGGMLGKCERHWLDRRLVIGAQGEVGLCCEDGLRTIVVGNLLEQDLSTVVSSVAFQEHLAIATGQKAALGDHPCRRCSFFGEV
jgi:hypothetical protein